MVNHSEVRLSPSEEFQADTEQFVAELYADPFEYKPDLVDRFLTDLIPGRALDPLVVETDMGDFVRQIMIAQIFARGKLKQSSSKKDAVIMHLTLQGLPEPTIVAAYQAKPYDKLTSTQRRSEHVRCINAPNQIVSALHRIPEYETNATQVMLHKYLAGEENVVPVVALQARSVPFSQRQFEKVEVDQNRDRVLKWLHLGFGGTLALHRRGLLAEYVFGGSQSSDPQVRPLFDMLWAKAVEASQRTIEGTHSDAYRRVMTYSPDDLDFMSVLLRTEPGQIDTGYDQLLRAELHDGGSTESLHRKIASKVVRALAILQPDKK